MTKLLEWLGGAGALGAIWLALLTNKIENPFFRDHYTFLLLSPIIVVGLFGLASLLLVLYRVYTFNDCNDAAAELQKEIVEAKQDLKSLGFKFKDSFK
ncbi:dolichol-phosphate mannosyltransferase subunit 3 [Dendroctonus ponderosae]|uniref:Dolichol-phosphate mannosyltransferase subunit 3 n=2 Tax=Dendroctonus ponderosae TaxID=77166 RepID=A0AAR5PEI2_DENPD|nr:dolichol-phosphate mannosyltransferase subunit 3 [Dendroctonus ponderosae]KAH1011433.1 hypothetical protein HUJ04_000805 [Dendroctonus ponderosae]KAH1011434.1 hypothetical protein HUJ04_000805 [Dendroctonus ponderosae]